MVDCETDYERWWIVDGKMIYNLPSSSLSHLSHHLSLSHLSSSLIVKLASTKYYDNLPSSGWRDERKRKRERDGR